MVKVILEMAYQLQSSFPVVVIGGNIFVSHNTHVYPTMCYEGAYEYEVCTCANAPFNVDIYTMNNSQII